MTRCSRRYRFAHISPPQRVLSRDGIDVRHVCGCACGGLRFACGCSGLGARACVRASVRAREISYLRSLSAVRGSADSDDRADVDADCRQGQAPNDACVDASDSAAQSPFIRIMPKGAHAKPSNAEGAHLRRICAMPNRSSRGQASDAQAKNGDVRVLQDALRARARRRQLVLRRRCSGPRWRTQKETCGNMRPCSPQSRVVGVVGGGVGFIRAKSGK